MAIRLLFLVLVSASIALTYYVMVVQRNFEVVTNPEGPDTSDYFLEETEPTDNETALP